jgi:hypothetical protein
MIRAMVDRVKVSNKTQVICIPFSDAGFNSDKLRSTESLYVMKPLLVPRKAIENKWRE